MSAEQPLDHAIPAARLHEIYSRTAAFYDEVVAVHQAAAKELALELLARRPGERCLEAGVGTGWAFARLIAATGAHRAVGLDPAPGMLTVARQRLGAGVDLVCADARHLPFADAAYDYVLCTYTLEVLAAPDIGLVLGELRRVLQPDGRIVVADLTPGEGEDAALTDDWQQRFERDPEYFGGARPLRLVPPLTAAGFVVQRRVYSGHGRGWPTEVVLATRRA